MKCPALVSLIVSLIGVTTASAFGDSNMEYTLTRARQLQQGREYAASAQLLDRYVDNIDKAVSRNDSLKLMELLTVQAQNFYYLGVTSRAADLYEQAVKIAMATGKINRLAGLYNELFIIHLNSGNTALSKDLLIKALELYESTGDKEGECKILNNLGILHYNLGELTQSLEYFKRSLSLAENAGIELKATIMSNIAECYVENGDLATAEKYLDKAIELRGHRYDTTDVLQAWINKAGIHARQGDSESARKILRDVTANIELSDPDRLVTSYTQIAHLYMEIGDSVAGLRWGLKAQELADSLHVKEENEQLREMLVRYNSERIADHNKMLELDIKRQKQVNYAIVACMVLVVVSAFYLIYKIRLDRKKNRLIRRQKEQLLEFERMEHDRKEQEFREAIDRKNRELTAYSIDAASISELHKILTDSLRKLIHKTDDSSARKEINDDILLLQNFNRNEVNEDFKVYFQEVHPDFARRLLEKFPALTPNDQRLCSFLYLGMSTKEIAALTFREIRSVESSRLRLRKKLGIKGDISLHDFLKNI